MLIDYILIVDDQDAIRILFGNFLQSIGYAVKSAANGWECLKMVRSDHRPRLILLDYQMPYMTGLEVLLVLKKDLAYHNIPVIMVSGTPDIKETAQKHGAHTVIAKPVELNILLETIHQALAPGNNRELPRARYNSFLPP